MSRLNSSGICSLPRELNCPLQACGGCSTCDWFHPDDSSFPEFRGLRSTFGVDDGLSGKAPDNVNHPHHYESSCSLECIEVMELVFGHKFTMNFCLGNAFKYFWRHKNKNGLEDIEKADWYINRAGVLYEKVREAEPIGLFTNYEEVINNFKDTLERIRKNYKDSSEGDGQ